jgi:hypothetical protein
MMPPIKAADFGNGDALHTYIANRFSNVIQLERLDNRGDEFHRTIPPFTWCSFADGRTASGTALEPKPVSAASDQSSLIGAI